MAAAAGVLVIGIVWLSRGSKSGEPSVRLMGETEPVVMGPAFQRMVPPSRVSENPAIPHQQTQPAVTTEKPPAEKVQPSPVRPSTQPASPPPAKTADPARAASDLQMGLAAKEHNELLAAREQINRALHGGLSGEQAATARQALAELAERTIFSPAIVPNDPLVENYSVAPGDALVRLAKRFKLSEDLVAELNHIDNKHFIRQGMRMKLLKGPFHAVISKSEHEMHLYLQDVYLRSFRVALGANGKTPTGRWKVANHQANPGWTDPRTGKRWHPDDPANPIGEYWIGLEGIDGQAAGAFGYGIHGTIELDSIGQDVSLGCIRLAPDDIARVYKLLVPGESTVTISD